MARRSRFFWLRRILLALLFVTVVWNGVRSVVCFVHMRQQDAMLQRMGLGDGCAAYDGDGYVFDLVLKEGDSPSHEVFGCLREFVHLRRLTIHCRGLTDQGLANLAGLTTLEELVVTPASGLVGPGQEMLSDEGLSHLRGLESLRKLHYHEARVTDAGMRHLEGLHNLEVLVLSCRKATDEGLKSLAKLDHLKSLWLFSGPGMTGEGMMALPDPSRLRELHLDFVSGAGMGAIARFTNLRDLSIGGPQLGVDGLKNLLVLSNLEKLTISRARVDNRALETVVGEMTWLKELNIQSCPMTGGVLKNLRRLKDLEVLWVSGSPVDDASTPYLEEFPNLTV